MVALAPNAAPAGAPIPVLPEPLPAGHGFARNLHSAGPDAPDAIDVAERVGGLLDEVSEASEADMPAQVALPDPTSLPEPVPIVQLRRGITAYKAAQALLNAQP